MAPSRFQRVAEDFVNNQLLSGGSSYSHSIDEDLSAGSDDPSKRSFKVTFSKPSKR